MTAARLTDLDLAHLLADAAGKAILPYFRQAGLIADNKLAKGFDPVTAADRAAEEAMRALLARHRPEDGIFGEEFGATPGRSGRRWVLDPIDGTRGFLSGTPTWGVLIALCGASGPELGIIDQPYTGERFVGAAGSAWMTGPAGRATPVRPSRSPRRAVSSLPRAARRPRAASRRSTKRPPSSSVRQRSRP